MWPDWVIYWTLGNFLKSLATINFPKSPTFLGNFYKGVKIYNFSSEIIFRQLLLTFGNFFWSHCWRTTELILLFSSQDEETKWWRLVSYAYLGSDRAVQGRLYRDPLAVDQHYSGNVPCILVEQQFNTVRGRGCGWCGGRGGCRCEASSGKILVGFTKMAANAETV